jgi:hypothetical protein
MSNRHLLSPASVRPAAAVMNQRARHHKRMRNDQPPARLIAKAGL